MNKLEKELFEDIKKTVPITHSPYPRKKIPNLSCEEWGFIITAQSIAFNNMRESEGKSSFTLNMMQLLETSQNYNIRKYKKMLNSPHVKRYIKKLDRFGNYRVDMLNLYLYRNEFGDFVKDQ